MCQIWINLNLSPRVAKHERSLRDQAKSDLDCWSELCSPSSWHRISSYEFKAFYVYKIAKRPSTHNSIILRESQTWLVRALTIPIGGVCQIFLHQNTTWRRLLDSKKQAGHTLKDRLHMSNWLISETFFSHLCKVILQFLKMSFLKAYSIIP